MGKIGRNKFSRKVFLVFMTVCMMASSALPVLAYEGDDEAVIDMSPFLNLFHLNVKSILPIVLIITGILIILPLIADLIRKVCCINDIAPEDRIPDWMTDEDIKNMYDKF